MEDNDLWLRHFLMLVFQAVTTLYVFLQSLTENKLMIPMILMFVSGCIKYLERTRSLYLASIDRFWDLMLKEPNAGPNYENLMEEYASKKLAKLTTQIIMIPKPDKKCPPSNPVKRRFDDLQLVHEAYRLFRIFRGQIVDLIFNAFAGNETNNVVGCCIGEMLEKHTMSGSRVNQLYIRLLFDLTSLKSKVMKNSDAVDLDYVSGDVKFSNISFRYAENRPLVLNGLKFHIKVGEIVAILSPSGGGKSSLVKLLLQLYEPSSAELFEFTTTIYQILRS